MFVEQPQDNLGLPHLDSGGSTIVEHPAVPPAFTDLSADIGIEDIESYNNYLASLGLETDANETRAQLQARTEPSLPFNERVQGAVESHGGKMSLSQRAGLGAAVVVFGIMSVACGGGGSTNVEAGSAPGTPKAPAETVAPQPRGVNILNIAESQPAKGTPKDIIAAILQNNQLAINTGNIAALEKSYVGGINNPTARELKAAVEKGIADRARVGFNTWGVDHPADRVVILGSDFDTAGPNYKTTRVVVWSAQGIVKVFRNDAFTETTEVGHHVSLLVTADGKPPTANSSWLVDNGIRISEQKAEEIAFSGARIKLARGLELKPAQPPAVRAG